MNAIEILFILGPVVVVPLGLEVARARRPLRWIPAPGAALAVGSFLAPAGPLAGALAGGWLLATLCVAAIGARRVLERGPIGLLRDAPAAVTTAGLLYLPVGGAWLVLSRLGARPMGFEEPILLLTAVHFHFAAFAACVWAGAAGRLLRERRGRAGLPFSFAAAAVVVGPALLAMGWALSLVPLKALASLVIAGSHVLLAILVLESLSTVRRGLARALLGIASGSVVFGMVLASVYAVTELGGAPEIGIPAMALSHGVLNGVGFAGLGLLGWAVEKR
jgi:hypothetical protein